MKKAIIIGINGQDGRYLEKLLSKLNYEIIGIGNDHIVANFENSFKKVDVSNFNQFNNLIKSYNPDEIYYLAAYHHSSEDILSNDLTLFSDSLPANVIGLINCLESINQASKKTKVFYAASQHVFGFGDQKINSEKTPLKPESIYGISKTTAVSLCEYYKNKHGLYIAIGYLYNHESPLRKNNFISKKVVEIAKSIKKGEKHTLYVGNMNAKIDWGFAKDYVYAFHKIMQLKKPENFIICSNNIQTVSTFVDAVFSALGLNYKKYVVEKPEIIKKEKQRFIPGDNKKLKSMTGWYPKTDFNRLVNILLNEKRN